MNYSTPICVVGECSGLLFLFFFGNSEKVGAEKVGAALFQLEGD